MYVKKMNHMYVKKMNLANLNRDFEQMSAFKAREDTVVAKGLIHKYLKVSQTSTSKSSYTSICQYSVILVFVTVSTSAERPLFYSSSQIVRHDRIEPSNTPSPVGSVLNYLQLLLAKVEPRRGVQKKLGKRDQR
jgi:hypothetical protein